MRRLVSEGEREVEPALHPAGVRLDLAVGGLREADPLEQRLAPLLALGPRHPVQRGLEAQVLAPREQRVEGGFLEGGADRGAHLLALAWRRRTPRPAPCPPRAAASVVSMCTVVDFPAPLGPRKP